MGSCPDCWGRGKTLSARSCGQSHCEVSCVPHQGSSRDGWVADRGAAEHFYFHNSVPGMLLVGKWCVFWSAVSSPAYGIFFQPRFIAEEIFDLRGRGDDRLPLAREPGVANLATGVVGIASLAKPQLRAAGASGAGTGNIAIIGDLLL